jgi:hypothetical protein
MTTTPCTASYCTEAGTNAQGLLPIVLVAVLQVLLLKCCCTPQLLHVR